MPLFSAVAAQTNALLNEYAVSPALPTQGRNVAQTGAGAVPPPNDVADTSAQSVKQEATRFLGVLRNEVAGEAQRVLAGIATKTARQVATADSPLQDAVTVPLTKRQLWIGGGILCALLVALVVGWGRKTPAVAT